MSAYILLLLLGRGAPALPQGRTSVSSVDRLTVEDGQSLDVAQEQHRLQVEEV